MTAVDSVLTKCATPLIRKLLLAGFLAGPFCSPKESNAALPPAQAKQNIVNFINDSAQRVKINGSEVNQDKSTDWHNLITAFYVLSELDIKEIEDIRKDVLRRGMTDSSTPFKAVQTAVCTSSIWANPINKQIKDLNQKRETLLAELDNFSGQGPERASKEAEKSELENSLGNLLVRKQEILSLVIPYRGKILSESYDKSFPMQVNNAIAQLSDQESINGIVPSYVEGSADAQEILIFSANNSSVSLPDSAREYALKATLRNNQLVANNFGGSSEEQNVSEVNEANPYNLALEAKVFYANNILLLALNKDPHAVEISQEWFKKRPPGKADEADFIALRALAICARSNQEAFNGLGYVAKTFPDVFDAYLFANNVLQHNLKRSSGQEILDTFNANPQEAKNLLHDLANNSTGTSRTSAIVALSTMIDMEGNLDFLRSIVFDSKNSDEDRVAAMIGLARSRNKDLIKPLLKEAINKSNSLSVMVNALKTGLIIDSEDPIPESYKERVRDRFPLGLDLSLFDFYFKDGKIRNDFVSTVLEDARLEEDAVYSLMKEIRSRFTYSNGYLATLGKDPEFAKEYLEPLKLLLQSSLDKQSFDFNFDLPLALILGNANYEGAFPLILQCVENPESSVFNTPDDQIFIAAQAPSGNYTFLRMVTLREMLGKVIPLGSLGSETVDKLFNVASGRDISLHDASLRALIFLAERYENENSETKEKYLSSALLLLEKFREPRTVHMTRSMDWYLENKREFDICNLVFKLGGAKNLAKIALEDKNAPLTRTIINVFIFNNFTLEQFAELKLAGKSKEDLESVYSYHANKEYSIPKTNGTGKGVSIALVDGGPLMEGEGVTVPDELIAPFRLEDQYSSHTGEVGKIVRSVAKDVRFKSGSWCRYLPFDPLMPDFLQDDPGYSFIAGVIKDNLLGRGETDILEQSRGFKSHRLGRNCDRKNIDIAKAPDRQNIAIANSILRFVKEAGILSLSSAGNDSGKYPGYGSYGPIGSLNPLGFEFDDKNNFHQIPGIIVGAYDPLTKKPLPFSSTVDLLRPEQKVNILGVDGIHLLRSGQYGATSFSTPFMGGATAVFIEMFREKHKRDPLPEEIIEAAAKASEPISGEAERAFDGKAFLGNP